MSKRDEKMKNIDLNSDLGESFGAYHIGDDERVLSFVTSANIACGFHAGDPVVMQDTVTKAIEKGVAIGAHPGYPDLMGFGRRHISISHKEAKAYMMYQIGALKAIVEAHGGKLQHVKPHGALYNTAAKEAGLAKALAEAVYAIDKDLIFVGLSGSNMIEEARKVGLRVANEVFADRAYDKKGFLVPRTQEGAVITDEAICIERVLKMVNEGYVESIEGVMIPLKADTICVHGDNEKAALFAERLKETLYNGGVHVCPLIK